MVVGVIGDQNPLGPTDRPGTAGVGPPKLPFNIIGATLWVGVWTTVGYLAGEHIDIVDDTRPWGGGGAARSTPELGAGPAHRGSADDAGLGQAGCGAATSCARR
jgi:hypothetical protein